MVLRSNKKAKFEKSQTKKKKEKKHVVASCLSCRHSAISPVAGWTLLVQPSSSVAITYEAAHTHKKKHASSLSSFLLARGQSCMVRGQGGLNGTKRRAAVSFSHTTWGLAHCEYTHRDGGTLNRRMDVEMGPRSHLPSLFNCCH